MSARSVARLTFTLSTPSSLASAASTRPTQDAQLMPSTGRLIGSPRVEAERGEFMVVSVHQRGVCYLRLSHRGKVNAVPARCLDGYSLLRCNEFSITLGHASMIVSKPRGRVAIQEAAALPDTPQSDA